jgi:Glyoxalase/Bleomycin resistance protein/Dioxygenase superfamily
VRQIGYVVEDFDAALASWLAAGVGPWYILRGLRMSAHYRGKPITVTLTIGLANKGVGLQRADRNASDGWDGSDPIRTLG